MNYDPYTGEPIANNDNRVLANNTMAIVGFILSIIGFSILGLIFSIVGYKKSKELGGNGKGLSIAGFVISILRILLYIVVCGMFIFSVYVQSEKDKQGYFAYNEHCSQASNCDCNYSNYCKCTYINEFGNEIIISCPKDNR